MKIETAMTDNKQAREDEVKPLTREGMFGYFDQMADKDGRIVTTSEWLADVGMLIVHEVEKRQAALQPLDDETGLKANAYDLLPCPFCGSPNADPKEWLRGDGVSGPGCGDCGATAGTLEAWNRRQGSLDGGWVSKGLPTRLDDYPVTARNAEGLLVSTWSAWYGTDWDIVVSGDFIEVVAWKEWDAPFVAGESDGTEGK